MGGGLDETGMGGRLRNFPTTIWSDILGAAEPGTPQGRALLENLLKTYWKPVFVFVRLSWRKTVEDAKDLTQAFFAHVLAKNLLARAEPDRGSFRSYLKRSLSNFIIDCERAAAVRRPDKPVFSLEQSGEELERLAPESPGDTPDAAYDRAWFDTVFRSAVVGLEEELLAEGKTAYLEVFRAYCLDSRGAALAEDAPAPSYRDLGRRLRLKETDVHNHLTYCRRLLRRLLRERIREYVSTEEEVDRELAMAMRI